MYVMSIVMGKLVPKAIALPMLTHGSKNYTLAFSNTPGFLKQMKFGDIDTNRMLCFVVSTGYIGITLCVQSYVDAFTVTIVADSGVLTEKETEELLGNMTSALN